jgi:undecaprenyl-diphosphatase
MTVFQAIIYGLVQGFGEFLPVSSSGHLVLLPWLFGWQDPGLSFDVALHFGTLAALVAYYWKEWIAIFGALFNKKFFNLDFPRPFIFYLALATVPGALAGFLFEGFADASLRNPLVIAATLSIFGYLLFAADKKSKDDKNTDKISLKNALLIGTAQAIAVIPGVSRSGATITAGRALGYDRKNSARFSFFLSVPIIFGAFVLKTGDFFRSSGDPVFITAIISSALSGYIAITFLVKFVQRSSYKPFFLYRLALAILIIALYYIKS